METLEGRSTTQLKKTKMSIWTVAFMIFCLCAGGCFGIEDMISTAGPGLCILMLIILPIIYGYPVGLMCAELGSAMPEEGGFYVWPREACGEFWGFQAGWWRTVGTYIDNTLYIILAGEYVGIAFNLESTSIFLVKMGCIATFTIVNLIGLKQVGRFSAFFSILVMAGFTLVAVVGFMNVKFNPIEPFITDADSVTMTIGAALAIGMWCYCGYESMSSVAGEIENPQVIPKALIIAIPAIAITYIVPTLAGVASLGHWDQWSSESGYSYAAVLGTYLGPAFGVGFAAIAIAANLSIYNSYVASGSRGFFVLADDYLAPKFLTKVGKKSGVPYMAILLMAVVNAILCNFAFSVVVVIGVFVYMFSLAMIMISGLIMRKKMPNRPKGTFKIPLSDNALIVLCVLPILVMIIALYTSGTDYFIGGLIGVLSGPIMYVIFKLKYGGLARIDSKKYPLNPKTRLGVNDLKHISNVLLLLCVISIIGCFFLPVYEGSWGAEYYFETYGIENIYNIMLASIKYFAIASFAGFIILRVMDKQFKQYELPVDNSNLSESDK